MSQINGLVIHFARPIAETVLENSTNSDRDDLNSDSSNSEQETVCLQDLFDSPEFMEEQRLLMLEFETSQLCIKNEVPGTPPRPQEDRRSRRSSIGIKLNCPVCLESLSSVRTSYVKMVTECGHVFCQSCIEDVCKAAAKHLALNAQPRGGREALCPVCRKEVGELRRVYF